MRERRGCGGGGAFAAVGAGIWVPVYALAAAAIEQEESVACSWWRRIAATNVLDYDAVSQEHTYGNWRLMAAIDHPGGAGAVCCVGDGVGRV